MKLLTTIKILDFIEKRIDHTEFEKWIYNNSDLESDLGSDVFMELISVDYRDKSSRVYVETIIEPIIDYGELHFLQLTTLIEKFLSRTIDVIVGLRELYDWCEKGYDFLAENLTIANYGEQGKSILSRRDLSLSLPNEKKWKILLDEDPKIIEDLELIRLKLLSKKIFLTGEFTNHKYYGKIFQFIEDNCTQQ